MDVLTKLRTALSAKQSVRVEHAKGSEEAGGGSVLIFPDGSKHPIGESCSYKQSRGTGEPYTIGAVWFYCAHTQRRPSLCACWRLL